MSNLITIPKKIWCNFNHQPWLVSLILLSIIFLWFGIGSINAQESDITTRIFSRPIAKVGYKTFSAQITNKKVELYGRTAPYREAQVAAEISGRVTNILVKKGQVIKAGQIIAQLDIGDLDAQVEKAKALVELRQQEFDAANSLKNRGYQGKVAYTNTATALTEAKTSLISIERTLEKTSLRAPFDGVVEELSIEKGDFVGIGDPAAIIIDLDKLIVEASIGERYITEIRHGQSAKVTFTDGSIQQGIMHFISRASSPATNTFDIEVEIDNSGIQLPAGVSSKVLLNLATQKAIKVTPSVLALDEEGNLGVKTINNGYVHFVPIELTNTEQNGVWLTGLGEQVDIITRGQGFVRDGDKVEAIALPSEEGDDV